jgi:hypothetical protein
MQADKQLNVAIRIDKKINRNIARRNWFVAQAGKPTPETGDNRTKKSAPT